MDGRPSVAVSWRSPRKYRHPNDRLEAHRPAASCSVTAPRGRRQR